MTIKELKEYINTLDDKTRIEFRYCIASNREFFAKTVKLNRIDKFINKIILTLE